MAYKADNWCPNCVKRETCKERGQVVQWKHCWKFEVDLVLLTAKKLQRITERNDAMCS